MFLCGNYVGKISIVLSLGKPRRRTIEILFSGVGDFLVLYSLSVRFYIYTDRIYKNNLRNSFPSTWFRISDGKKKR